MYPIQHSGTLRLMKRNKLLCVHDEGDMMGAVYTPSVNVIEGYNGVGSVAKIFQRAWGPIKPAAKINRPGCPI